MERAIKKLETQFLELLASPMTLPDTVVHALQQLLSPSDLGDAMLLPLRRTLLSLAERIEGGTESPMPLESEPAYHNRQHAREVVVALLLLIGEEDRHAQDPIWPLSLWPVLNPRERCMGLLAALGHDYLHPGGVNRHAHELEGKAAEAVETLMQAEGVTADGCLLVRHLILATEFEGVAALHQHLSGLPFNEAISTELRLAILLTEADVLPGVLPRHGIHLGQLLAREWRESGVLDRGDPSSPPYREAFLGRVRFSSPHARALGL